MWIGNIFARQQQNRQRQTRTENRICFGRSDLNKYCLPRKLNEYRAGMHRGVVFIYSSCWCVLDNDGLPS